MDTPSAPLLHFPQQPPSRSIDTLPDNILRSLASFLLPDDTRALAQSCSALRRSLRYVHWHHALVVPNSSISSPPSSSPKVPLKALLKPYKYTWFPAHKIVKLILSPAIVDVDRRRAQLATWRFDRRYYGRLRTVVLDLTPGLHNYDGLRESRFYRNLQPYLQISIRHYTYSSSPDQTDPIFHMLRKNRPRREFFYDLRESVTALDLYCFLPKTPEHVQVPPGLALLAAHYADLPSLRTLVVLVDFARPDLPSVSLSSSSSSPSSSSSSSLFINSTFRSLADIPPTLRTCVVRFRYVPHASILAPFSASPATECLTSSPTSSSMSDKFAIPVVTDLECHAGPAPAARGCCVDLPTLLAAFSFPRARILTHNELGLAPCVFHRAFGGRAALPRLVLLELRIDSLVTAAVAATGDDDMAEFFRRFRRSLTLHRPNRILVCLHLQQHFLYRQKIAPFLRIVRKDYLDHPRPLPQDSSHSPPLSARVMDALVDSVGQSPPASPPAVNPVVELLGLLAEPQPVRIFDFQHHLSLCVNEAYLLLAHVFFEAVLYHACLLDSLEYLQISSAGKFFPVSHCLQRLASGVSGLRQIFIATKLPPTWAPYANKRKALKRVLRALPIAPYTHHAIFDPPRIHLDTQPPPPPPPVPPPPPPPPPLFSHNYSTGPPGFANLSDHSPQQTAAASGYPVRTHARLHSVVDLVSRKPYHSHLDAVYLSDPTPPLNDPAFCEDAIRKLDFAGWL